MNAKVLFDTLHDGSKASILLWRRYTSVAILRRFWIVEEARNRVSNFPKTYAVLTSVDGIAFLESIIVNRALFSYWSG
jgi:hypothetical protein